ncbi:MAG: hypothetical protein IEMM0002_0150 [bacterium]|nr:MAG: hypothetical protein IEMM0002_0150 [bacterium]
MIDPVECDAVCETPPDIVDIKDPSTGSLGMPDIRIIKEIRARIPLGIPVSVAIGDAYNDVLLFRSRAEKAVLAGADIVKVGLYRFTDGVEAADFLASVSRGLDAEFIAVGYADLIGSSEIEILKLPEIARNAGIEGCMLDTFHKTCAGLTGHMEMRDIRRFVERCRDLRLSSALAGGLGVNDIGWLTKLQPGVAGFRSGVSGGARDEPGIDRMRLAGLINRDL